MSAASNISRISSTVGILSSAYLPACGSTRLIFFQLSEISFISKSNFTAFMQLATVAVVISPTSALIFCFEIKDIIVFQ